MKGRPTIERLRLIFDYRAETGELIWKVRTPETFKATQSRTAERLCRQWNSARAGEVAGGLRNGYLRVRVDGRKITATHVIWALLRGEWPKDQIDHRDGFRSRNVEENLREATNAQNSQNKKKRRTNRSGLTGVWKQKNRWRSEIAVGGQRLYLGMFKSSEEARAAYLAAKATRHSFQPQPRAEA